MNLAQFLAALAMAVCHPLSDDSRKRARNLLSVNIPLCIRRASSRAWNGRADAEAATRSFTSLSVKSSLESPYKNISLSYDVMSEGLDLASDSGAQELEKRVNEAALAACQEIRKMYPDSTPSEEECAKAAQKKAMYKVHRLIKTARQGPAKTQ